jgi:hypothetical protein
MQDTQVDQDDKHTYTLQANQSKRVMENSWQMQSHDVQTRNIILLSE